MPHSPAPDLSRDLPHHMPHPLPAQYQGHSQHIMEGIRHTVGSNRPQRYLRGTGGTGSSWPRWSEV